VRVPGNTAKSAGDFVTGATESCLAVAISFSEELRLAATAARIGTAALRPVKGWERRI
jgi:hypothetical protein